nr:ribonuclease H-like domain-containing protein [Candidatus Sigynarchaeota archaeon]
MLEHTFIHVPGIGQKTENNIWTQGVATWDDVDKLRPFKGFPRQRLTRVKEYISKSKNNLQSKDGSFFSETLPSGEIWRAFKEFRSSSCYLDIETTGFDYTRDLLTTIGTWDGKESKSFVYGKNLFDFVEYIKRFKCIITFFGKGFDVPFITNWMGIQLPQLHIDLCFVFRSLGIRGGLKKIEHGFGMSRGELEGVDGFEAVRLWFRYQKEGNQQALDKLLAYNLLDVVNLEPLMVKAYNLKVNELNQGFKLLEK